MISSQGGLDRLLGAARKEIVRRRWPQDRIGAEDEWMKRVDGWGIGWIEWTDRLDGWMDRCIQR